MKRAELFELINLNLDATVNVLLGYPDIVNEIKTSEKVKRIAMLKEDVIKKNAEIKALET